MIVLLVFFVCCSSARIHKMAIQHNSKGVEMIKAGNYEMAEKSLELALEYNKNYSEPYNNLGIIYLKQNKLDKAEEYFSLALQYNGDFAEAHNNLGYVYLLKGKLNRAEQRFKSALNIDPSFVNARLNLSRLYIITNRVDLAEQELLKLKLISKEEEIYDLLFNIYVKTNMVNKAFELVNEMISSKKYFSKGVYYRGFINLMLNRCEEAVVDMLKAHPDYVNNLEYYINLSAAYICKKDYENAENILKDVLKMQPDEPSALFNLGRIAYENKNYLDAENYFRKSYNSGFGSACSFLVDTLFINGKEDESKKFSLLCR